MADVFEIQDEIVASIVEALVPALLGEAATNSPASIFSSPSDSGAS